MKTLLLNYRITIYCMAIISIVFYSNAYAQWANLGQGAGGHVRAVNVVTHAGSPVSYDLYIGSDVAGVWVAKGITDLTDAAQYHYEYINNHEIMGKLNVIYSPTAYTSDFLLVGNESGIHRIDKTATDGNMLKILDLPEAWVSGMYVTKGFPTEHRIYFITGDIRVGETEFNHKGTDVTHIHDFYWATLNSGENAISNVTGIDLPGLNTVVGINSRSDVYALYVDEGPTDAQGDDKF